MHRSLATLRWLVLVVGLLLLAAGPASAHDCSSQADCEQTTGYVGGIATIGGIIAILTGILGSQLGGGLGGAIGGAAPAPPAEGSSGGGIKEGVDELISDVTRKKPQPGMSPEEFQSQTTDDATKIKSVETIDELLRDPYGTAGGTLFIPPGGPATSGPAPSEPATGEPEVPWDDLIGATEPPAGAGTTPGEGAGGDEPEVPWDDLIRATEPPDDDGTGGPSIDDLLGPGEPEDLPEPGETEPVDVTRPPTDPGDEIDELLGPEPGDGEPASEGGGEEEDPLDGEKGIDEVVPIDELLEPPGGGDGEPTEAGAGEGEGEEGEGEGEEGEEGEGEPTEAGTGEGEGEEGEGEGGEGEGGEGEAGEKKPPVKAGGEATVPPSDGTGEKAETKPGDEKPGGTTVKPRILEVTEAGEKASDLVKEGGEKVAEWGKELGENVDKVKDVVKELGDNVSDATKKKIDETLDYVGERAKNLEKVGGQVKEVAEKSAEILNKANEYGNTMNETFERTEKMGLNDDQANGLVYTQVVAKGSGEAAEKFVDSLLTPVTTPLKAVFGDKVDDAVHEVLPVKEFGKELGDAVVNTAERMVHQEQREMVDDYARAHPNDPSNEDLDFLKGWGR